jgi:hypothetical protein
MDPEMVRQQQEAEREALEALARSILADESTIASARPGRASLFLGTPRSASPLPEGLSALAGQAERVVRAPFAAAELMAGLSQAALQYANFITQMMGAMFFAPANLFLAGRAPNPFGMTAPPAWRPYS